MPELVARLAEMIGEKLVGLDPVPVPALRAIESRGYVAEGFRAVKIRDRDFAVEPVARSRAGIGADVRLIVDTNQSFTPPPATFGEALRYARRIAEYDMLFLEEPLAVGDAAGYRRMVGRAPMPISGGETLDSAARDRQHIDAGAFDMRLRKPTAPGLGVELTEKHSREYAYVPGTHNPGSFR